MYKVNCTIFRKLKTVKQFDTCYGRIHVLVDKQISFLKVHEIICNHGNRSGIGKIFTCNKVLTSNISLNNHYTENLILALCIYMYVLRVRMHVHVNVKSRMHCFKVHNNS